MTCLCYGTHLRSPFKLFHELVVTAFTCHWFLLLRKHFKKLDFSAETESLSSLFLEDKKNVGCSGLVCPQLTAFKFKHHILKCLGFQVDQQLFSRHSTIWKSWTITGAQLLQSQIVESGEAQSSSLELLWHSASSNINVPICAPIMSL